ncbi:MAG: UDP-3-O-(3-hydroxymyristoyl)glucosamine N-acyltransferase [Synergistaceae bacterium]|jgi:UDP-3-O-[3-hydroxymyristoyl] glucosamine N-acyltransferase|nr:UDP-3-O-(3-hydroxymyristoyl)glucosamine N-acyltransferase [Synergistaceae bacterium]
MEGISIARVAEITGGALIGDGERRICGLCAPDEPQADKLCVVWDRGALERIPGDVPVLAETGSVRSRDGVEMDHPREALVNLLPLFDRRISDEPCVHPRAFVHENSAIGEDCFIGPGCVISEGAVIGGRVVLQANVFIGKNAVVGDDTRIEAFVSIQDFVEIGRRTLIHSGAVIGCDGFGFVPGQDGKWEKIPQIGTVLIGDDVEIGANSTIDRATFGVTRIGDRTKLGVHVHIAHNCEVGPDCMMVGFTPLGGSSKLGRRVLVAGMSGIADHVTVGDDVTVAGRSGVTKDLKSGLTVSGFPAQEHMAEKRFQASLRRARDYGERLKRIERFIGNMAAGVCEGDI